MLERSLFPRLTRASGITAAARAIAAQARTEARVKNRILKGGLRVRERKKLENKEWKAGEEAEGHQSETWPGFIRLLPRQRSTPTFQSQQTLRQFSRSRQSTV